MPKRRVGPVISAILYALAALVDASQIILDFFVIGVAINRVVDIAMGFFLVLAFLLLRILNIRTAISLLLTFVAEEIPLVDIAPAWVLDVWYTLSRAKAQDLEKIAAYEQEQQLTAEEMEERKQLQIATYIRRAEEEEARRAEEGREAPKRSG